MERDTTMPSILGPASGYEAGSRSAARDQSDEQSVNPLLKLVIWTALGVVLWGIYRVFAH